MTACQHHLNDGPLVCRNDNCNGTHVYESTSGIPDCAKEE